MTNMPMWMLNMLAIDSELAIDSTPNNDAPKPVNLVENLQRDKEMWEARAWYLKVQHDKLINQHNSERERQADKHNSKI